MAHPGEGQLAAIGVMVAALLLLLAGPVSGAEQTRVIEASVAPGPFSFTMSGTTMAFGSVAIGTSVDSTDGAGGSTTSTNNSIGITNTSGAGPPSVKITSLTLDYTDATPGANCGVGEGDWVPDSSNAEGSIGTDEFVMYGDLANDLLTKVVIPADGNPTASLTIPGNWRHNQTRDLDLQLFMPLAVTTGTSACAIALTITTVP